MTDCCIEDLKKWFVQSKREFPWRISPSPYAVWISEVMLQQTRAAVVVPYFERWMQKFPTISALAEAPLEEAVKVWEGLGYYSRVRNLHKGAVEISKKGGGLPDSREGLLEISGIGPYTAGAILSFAFHKKAVAIDGNVERVVSRYKAIEGDLKKAAAKRRLEEECLSLLPEKEPWIVMEALIELGATFCLPRPSCDKCPLQKNCAASLQGATERIPFKQKRAETVFLEKHVAVLVCGEEALIQKKEEGGLLGGLAEFPSLPAESGKDLEEWIGSSLGLEALFKEELSLQKHTFTKYHVELQPSLFQVLQKKEIVGCAWRHLDDLEKNVTFSSGHKKILQEILLGRKGGAE